MNTRFHLSKQELEFLETFCDIRYTPEQCQQIRHALEAGLSFEDIPRLFSWRQTPEQMQELIFLTVITHSVYTESQWHGNFRVA